MRNVPVGTFLLRTTGAAWATLPNVLFDLRHDPVLRIEEAGVRLRPAAEVLRVDREEPRTDGELELAERGLVDRAVADRAPDLLGGLAPEELQERLRELLVLALVEHGDRRVDAQRRLRDDVEELLALLLREDGLVLVREED